jgi:hypothetical protein
MLPEEPKQARRNTSNGGDSKLKVDEWLIDKGVNFTSLQWRDGATRYRLACCPFNDSHGSPDAAIFQWQNGATSFRCLHNSCSGRKWATALGTSRGLPSPGANINHPRT